MKVTDPRTLLARAENAVDRKKAVSSAMAAGMALHEIEEFLDWADAVRAQWAKDSSSKFEPASISANPLKSTESVSSHSGV